MNGAVGERRRGTESRLAAVPLGPAPGSGRASPSRSRAEVWGPPLWLEVTMCRPDSDRWPANTQRNESWNWQSPETCAEAENLFDQAADDDQLLIAVGRYTVLNLILNAVHEIGEWFRFDGRRVFPAHPSARASSGASDGQGNGSVQLTVTFSPPARPTPAFPMAQPVHRMSAQRQLQRLIRL